MGPLQATSLIAIGIGLYSIGFLTLGLALATGPYRRYAFLYPAPVADIGMV
jgi:hypothetical protein